MKKSVEHPNLEAQEDEIRHKEIDYIETRSGSFPKEEGKQKDQGKYHLDQCKGQEQLVAFLITFKGFDKDYAQHRNDHQTIEEVNTPQGKIGRFQQKELYDDIGMHSEEHYGQGQKL